MNSYRSKGAFLCLGGLLLSFATAVWATAPAAPQGQDVVVTFLDATSFQKFVPDNTTVYLGNTSVVADEVLGNSQYFVGTKERKLTVEFTGKGGLVATNTVRLGKPKGGVTWVTYLADPASGAIKKRSVKHENKPRNRQRADAQLNLSARASAGPPANDDCANAIAIGDGATAFSNTGATTDSPSDASCQFDGQTYNDVWYSYTASCDGEATISACGTADYDTDISVWTGSCGSLTLAGCADDTTGCAGFTSEVVIPVTAGTTYLIAVGSFSSTSGTGSGTLNISCDAPPMPPANDDCATPLVVTCNSSTTVDNTLATTDAGDPDHPCRFGTPGPGEGTIWFEFTATEPSAFIETNNSAVSDTIMTLFEGSCGSLTAVACSEDEGDGLLSEISISNLNVGTTYLIMVSSFSTFSLGEITLDITCPAPEGACCFEDGSCSDEIEVECLAEFGDWDPTTTCASNPCPQPPANDECDTAEVIASFPASATFNNEIATSDIPVGTECGVFSGPFSNAWYELTGTGNTITVTTCNAGTTVSDTKIAVYCRDCGDRVCVTGNDDDCVGFAAFLSTASFASQAGSKYLVTVGNFSSFTTPGDIQVDFSDDGVPASGAVECRPQGACCIGGQSCVIATQADCDMMGGDYVGDNVPCGSNVVNDGGFEAGAFGGTWNEASTNFGTPLCDTFSCGTGGSPDPHFDGAWWCWFGGISGVVETGSVSQLVNIPAAPDATLEFYLEIPAAGGSGNDFMRARIDGDVLFEALDTDQASYNPYTQVTVDVSFYADGGNHNLSFLSSTTGFGPPPFPAPAVTNFFVDAVSLNINTSGCQ